MTKNAAIFVLLIGSTISTKNFISLAPSPLAASASSSGMLIKNHRNKNVALAEAINGKIKTDFSDYGIGLHINEVEFT